MFQPLSALCFFTYIMKGSSTINKEVLKNSIDMDIKNIDHDHDLADGVYPYVVSVAFIEDPLVTRHCSGAFIRLSWVLSSSHCFYDLLDEKFYVWYGNFTISPVISKLYTEVLKIHIHPDFFSTKFTKRGFFFGDNDISLLNVKRVVLPYYGRLSNIDYSKMYGLTVKYIGGAARNFKSASKSIGRLQQTTRGFAKNKSIVVQQFRPLQIGEGIVVNCGLELTMWSKYVLCIAPKCSDRSHQPLHGDFGGPFIYDGKIVGVMSLSFKLPKTFLSSNGLTPVSPYWNWIHRITKPVKKN